MAAVIMFQSYQLTATTADQGRMISFTPGQSWVAVGIIVSAVSGSPSVVFKLQWSFDNTTWTDDPGAAATITAPGFITSGQRPIQGFYWRIAAVFSGTGSMTCSAGAIY